MKNKISLNKKINKNISKKKIEYIKIVKNRYSGFAFGHPQDY